MADENLSDRLRQKYSQMRQCIKVKLATHNVTVAVFLPLTLTGVIMDVSDRR